MARWRMATRVVHHGDGVAFLARALPADADVEIIDEAGHFLQLEQPKLVNRTIIDFLT